MAARGARTAAGQPGEFISGGSADASTAFVAAFRKGLAETGFVEGQNVKVEYHWLEGKYDQLPELAADLVSRQVALITTSASTPAALAAKAATAIIPIVFGVAQDPVQLARSGRQPCPAWRQRDWHQFLQPGGSGQTAAAPT